MTQFVFGAFSMQTFVRSTCVVLALASSLGRVAAQQSTPIDLLSIPVAPSGGVPSAAAATILNPEFIQVLPPVLAATGADGTPDRDFRLHFNSIPTAIGSLPAQTIGRVHTVVRPAPGTTVLHGELERGDRGEFTVTVVGDVAVARVMTPEGAYVVHPGAGNAAGYVTWRPLDAEEDEAPPEPALEPGHRKLHPNASLPKLPLLEDGSRVDVLIAYTQSTREYWGGKEKVETAARDAETNMNEALARSLPGANPPLRIRLVNTVEVPDSVPFTLVGMRNSPVLKELRTTNRADLVLVFHHADPGYPGQASIYCGDATVGQKRAFGFVRKDAIFWKKMTPVHELGHLFGAAHNPGHAGNCWERYMRGHRFDVVDPDGKERHYGTLMAYWNRRLRNFSNPQVSFRGVPTGRTDRNNSAALLGSRKVISNYMVNNDDVSDPSGPIIANLRPAVGAVFRPKSEVVVEARVADGDRVNKVELFWERTGNYLICPGSGRDWNCTATGDRYLWSINVGASGVRSYFIRAVDGLGHIAKTATRTLLVQKEAHGPLIQVLQPEDNAQLPAKSTIKLVSRIADGDGISTVELNWPHTNSRFRCPGTDNKDWTCTQEGDLYTWSIDVGTGTRTFAIEATDSQGTRTVSPLQRITLK